MHQLEKARADETEALASDIIRSMTTGLVSLDPLGTVVLVNPAAERIFGLEAAKVLKLSFAEVFPGSPALVARADEALEHTAPITFVDRRSTRSQAVRRCTLV